MADYLFVYGTLRRCWASPLGAAVEARCRYVGEGYLQGLLYDALKGYPGAVESLGADDKVHGELLEILGDGGDLLALLDEYEECADHFPHPHEYIRKRLSVTLCAGSTVQAWVYLYNHDLAGLKPIVSGDFVAYLREADGAE